MCEPRDDLRIGRFGPCFGHISGEFLVEIGLELSHVLRIVVWRVCRLFFWRGAAMRSHEILATGILKILAVRTAGPLRLSNKREMYVACQQWLVMAQATSCW